MSKTSSASLEVADEVDPMIAHYEAMDLNAVKQELRDEGINPNPAIEKVKKLVSTWERSQKA